jgi:hypothetical protein
MMPVPAQPKIYHIVHVDRLASIVADKRIWCDAEVIKRAAAGTMIGMSEIKERRLKELKLQSHPDLFVGQCTPFYFCPRSVMLYLIYQGNHPNLTYRGGQGPIVHLEADLKATIAWAKEKNRKWAFTLSNAGARYFEDHNDVMKLDEINWDAVAAEWWQGAFKEAKQAEFLIERSFPWHLVERIGIHSATIAPRVSAAMKDAAHKPIVEIKRDWYY